MFASRTRDPGKDHYYCPLGFLESLIFMVVFIFFLIVFFVVPLIIFSRVSINEGVAISDGVISFRVPMGALLLTPSVVRLGCFDYGLFYFLCCDFRLAQVSRKRTFFDFDLPVCEMLTWRVASSGSFRRVFLRPLIGEYPGAVLVLHWDVRLLRVLLVLLGSYCRVFLPCVFLRLLALIFFYCTRPDLTHI